VAIKDLMDIVKREKEGVGMKNNPRRGGGGAIVEEFHIRKRV